VGRRAFSLVELALVLVILALAAGTVAVGVRGTLARVTLADCLDEIEVFDRTTRRLATEQGEALRLVVDLARGRLRRTGADGREERGVAYRLPDGWRIAEVRLVGRRVTTGTVAVSVSARGLGPTYALRLGGAEGRGCWIAVAGLTGQTWEPEDEDAVQQVFETIGRRGDAR
jgi:prepilin-type N-terminal cleavage/methylation domain-containing protein